MKAVSRCFGRTAVAALALTALAMLPGNCLADDDTQLPEQLVDALNSVFGKHPASRAVHAKGVLLTGTFTPSREASSISKATHFNSGVIPVVVRFSAFAGIPDITDNDPHLSGPRGMAIKFQLPDETTTDIVSHSVNGFPSATAADFRDLLLAIGSSGPSAAKPTALDQYLGSHPTAVAFLTLHKPFPESYGSLPYFGVNAFKFTNADAKEVFGRYQIRPVAGDRYIDDEKAAMMSGNYLAEEIERRVGTGPIEFALNLQIAEKEDVLDNPTITWPDSRRTVPLGVLRIAKFVPGSEEQQQELLFLPEAVPDGIEAADPMIGFRSGSYGVSYARRHE